MEILCYGFEEKINVFKYLKIRLDDSEYEMYILNSNIYLYAGDCKIYYSNGKLDNLSPLQDEIELPTGYMAGKLPFQKYSACTNLKGFDLPNFLLMVT